MRQTEGLHDVLRMPSDGRFFVQNPLPNIRQTEALPTSASHDIPAHPCYSPAMPAKHTLLILCARIGYNP